MLNFINSIGEYAETWIRINRTIRELSMLTDKELKDIGIYRCEIPYIAYMAHSKWTGYSGLY